MPVPKTPPVMALPRVCVIMAGMFGSLRLVVVPLLALALALAGPARALTPAHAAGIGPMVLCSDEGVQTIYLDAGGAPIPAPSPADCATCPECVGAPVLFTPPAQVGLALHQATGGEVTIPARLALPPSRPLRPETRGPPPEAHAENDMAPAALPHHAAPRRSGGTCLQIGRPQTEARA